MYRVHRTKPEGNNFHFPQTWPSIASLQGRTDAQAMRVTEILFSKWGSNDMDLSGLKLKTSSGESELIGKERQSW